MSRTYRNPPDGHFCYAGRNDEGWVRGKWKPWPGLKAQRQKYNRPERHKAKQQLRKGEEPFPHQPRGRAKWDCW